jgi:hypothetical protein
MIQSEILNELNNELAALEKTSSSFTEDQFFQNPAGDKWSAAQNMEHLFLATKPLVGLFGTPGIMIERWGKSSRPSRSYDEVVAEYLKIVGNAGKASASTTPQATEPTKGEQIVKFEMLNDKFVERVEKLSEIDLDTYQVPHPLIGILTVREFLYFTLYHSKRHHEAIKNALNSLRN